MASHILWIIIEKRVFFKVEKMTKSEFDWTVRWFHLQIFNIHHFTYIFYLDKNDSGRSIGKWPNDATFGRLANPTSNTAACLCWKPQNCKFVNSSKLIYGKLFTHIFSDMETGSLILVKSKQWVDQKLRQATEQETSLSNSNLMIWLRASR